MTEITRREVLQLLGASLVTLPFSRIGYAQPRVNPSDKFPIACIGVGSQGLRVLLDLLRMPEVQIVAVCDANRGGTDYLEWGPNELRNKVRTTLGDPSWGESNNGPAAGREVAQRVVNTFYAHETGKADYSGCAAYEDYRELLSKEKDVEGVIVSTPDHLHALISIAAMRAGKHVYSQKPMAHNVWESREMPRVAKETGRATQVSIFNSDSVASRQVHDAIGGGAIGAVHAIDIWTTRASSFWKQGLPTPAHADPVPAGLDWDLWLGPAAMRPYSHVYQPFVWRAWYDFGCGALGDMGEYGLDTITRAVDLGVPDRIYASSTELFPQSFPVGSAVHFHFPANAHRPELALNWFDGGFQPGRPPELSPSIPLESEGVIYHGATGKLLTAYMGQNPRLLEPSGKLTPLYPASAAGETPFLSARPALGPSASGADTEHYSEWIKACRGGAPARANYEFEQPIVETLMLGCIAQRTHEDLVWDSANMRFTQGSVAAEALIRPPMRAPFAI